MILTYGNTYDTSDKIYSDTYLETIKLDSRHNLSLWSNGSKNSIPQIDIKGKRIIEQVFSYDEYSFEFIYNVNTLRQLANLKRFDYFTIQTDYETITPEEFEISTDDFAGNNEQFRKCKIIFRTNFVNKKTGDTNNTYTENTVPVAQSPLITGSPVIGQTLTATYTYYDADGDLEGTTTFTWWRADDNIETNKQLISGETAQTYVQTSADYNMWIWCQITPVALTGETPGLTVLTQYFQSEVDNVPFVTDVEISAGSFPIVSKTGTITAEYVYTDIEGHLEGTSVFDWQLAKDVNGLDAFSFGTTNPINTPFIASWYTHIRVGVIPVALTGNSPGVIVYSDWIDLIGS